MSTVDIKLSGPLVLGRGTEIVDDLVEDLTRELAQQGLAEVHQVLNTRIQNPTPYYETQVTLERQGPALWRVHDRGVIYGRWLEGIGSRNYPVTSFRGYKAFRTGWVVIVFTGDQLAANVAQRYTPRLRGQ